MNLSAVVFISTADESVSSRKKKKKKKKISFISTVDESINSRYSRRRRRSVDGAGTKKFSRSYSVQQLKIQQMKRGASFGMSCDDIRLDVITISRWSEARELKRRRVEIQQMD
ncbi:Kinesin heavy chain-like protein [Dorcoceras hygrometricum]|uniref:Kinesin heavy chain-like protein n=1 Tax=Dorcoceras hygrometricum TaxID=472368 RepID=A0A2Z6ZR74_9LAMI|nr:Kinesin heavy chain-like protein [Dorcoceras hygrometricum]